MVRDKRTENLWQLEYHLFNTLYWRMWWRPEGVLIHEVGKVLMVSNRISWSAGLSVRVAGLSWI